MKNLIRVAVAALTSAALLGAIAGAASAAGPRSEHPVFVQTDNLTGNQVVAYDRASNGALSQVAVYNTGGDGGALEGSQVDHLASQGSLAYDARHRLLVAVNAGSDTVSVFGVSGDQLALRQVIGSGGSFPSSIAIDGNLVFVLNAEGTGSIQGYGIVAGHLDPISGSHRDLGLSATETPRFTHTPGQVAFSPDGSQLIVTTKANGSAIETFAVRGRGRLSPAPVVNSLPGAVPFAVAFDPAGHMLVAEAGTNALANFVLNDDGTITEIGSAGTGQEATCWVSGLGREFFTGNAGSATLSHIREEAGGNLTLLGNTGTDPGTVDGAISGDGQFLYVQTGGNGIVDEFALGAGGTLTPVGSVLVPNAVGGEGIVAL
jgi:hypothetical protein